MTAQRLPFDDTFAGAVATLFHARPNVWINGLDIAKVGGVYAWRSRLSDLRKPPYRMVIVNRVRRLPGRSTRVSEYKYEP